MKIIVVVIAIFISLIALGIFFSWYLTFSIGLTILGSLGYLEKAFNIQLPTNRIRYLLILFLLLSAANIITSTIKSYQSERKIAEISNSYRPIEEIAVERFPGLPKDEAIKKYLNDISRTENDNKQLKEENRRNKEHISELMTNVKVSQEIAIQANRTASEIKDRQAPRIITNTAATSIIASIKNFSGQKYTAVIAATGNDVRPLWNKLDEVLMRAGWVRVNPSGLAVGNPPAGVLIEPSPGVELGIDKASYISLRPAVETLAKSLNLAGIRTTLFFRGDPKETRLDVITLVIGPKP